MPTLVITPLSHRTPNAQAILLIRGEHQKLVVDSIVWGFKHTDRNISEMGLEILFDLLQHISRHPDVAPGFYQVGWLRGVCVSVWRWC